MAQRSIANRCHAGHCCLYWMQHYLSLHLLKTIPHMPIKDQLRAEARSSPTQFAHVCIFLFIGLHGMPGTAAELSPAAQLGRRIFHDASLSASGKQSCASCHDPAHA